jgi:hypothetical protein
MVFISVHLSTSSNSAPATSLYSDGGEQHGSLPTNGSSSSSYVASHPPLMSMDGALSDAATVLDTSRNLEPLTEGPRGRGYSLVSAPSIEDTAAILNKRSRVIGLKVGISLYRVTYLYNSHKELL